MSNEFHATYEDGVLRLDVPLSLPEHARVTGRVIEVESPVKQPADDSNVSQSAEEFERLLDEFSIRGCQPLAADFSRADIYFDHD